MFVVLYLILSLRSPVVTFQSLRSFFTCCFVVLPFPFLSDARHMLSFEVHPIPLSFCAQSTFQNFLVFEARIFRHGYHSEKPSRSNYRKAS